MSQSVILNSSLESKGKIQLSPEEREHYNIELLARQENV
jgi:hypothetical protein